MDLSLASTDFSLAATRITKNRRRARGCSPGTTAFGAAVACRVEGRASDPPSRGAIRETDDHHRIQSALVGSLRSKALEPRPVHQCPLARVAIPRTLPRNLAGKFAKSG